MELAQFRTPMVLPPKERKTAENNALGFPKRIGDSNQS